MHQQLFLKLAHKAASSPHFFSLLPPPILLPSLLSLSPPRSPLPPQRLFCEGRAMDCVCGGVGAKSAREVVEHRTHTVHTEKYAEEFASVSFFDFWHEVYRINIRCN